MAADRPFLLSCACELFVHAQNYARMLRPSKKDQCVCYHHASQSEMHVCCTEVVCLTTLIGLYLVFRSLLHTLHIRCDLEGQVHMVAHPVGLAFVELFVW